MQDMDAQTNCMLTYVVCEEIAEHLKTFVSQRRIKLYVRGCITGGDS